jgi:hypothetical protein
VVAAALSSDPHNVAMVFHKYDGASPNPWTQPATSDTPDLSGTAGKYAPLWTDEPGGAEVIYDSSFDVYLAVYQSSAGIKLRASSDLIHWSGPIRDPYHEADRTLYYPTLLGETGDPTIAGSAPRVYFSSFPTGSFPDYTRSIFESVQLTLSTQTSTQTSLTTTSVMTSALGSSFATTSAVTMPGLQYSWQGEIGLLVTAAVVAVLAGIFVLRKRRRKP